MYFQRKAYEELLEWKEQYADRYAVLLEGARRVGKSTIAEQFYIISQKDVNREDDLRYLPVYMPPFVIKS